MYTLHHCDNLILLIKLNTSAFTHTELSPFLCTAVILNEQIKVLLY